ncbi:class I SAM-dependent methyltransferase [Qipengyuania sp. 6B39]|uniref:class I SAM-dependent methyltransferase n=1 Tax=Qipengyuania proteolytica TaxID=2867239 RepID=UPI001C89B074|nr:class I SAM-dependent methyltransferase [Qipengyuania proteolytica]MBX7496428.1 class I SAM-dependent methyltransferase [Qipengyuania proteolytica]
MTDRSEWTGRVGESWAREWQRTDRSFGPVTDVLLAQAEARDFASAVDIGCGAGEMTLRLGEKHPYARVLGLDVSEDLVEQARGRTAGLPNVRIELGDAAGWQAREGERPDLLVSRHGVMFFDDPVGAFASLARTAQTDARLVFSCFREPRENGWVRALRSALPRQDGPPADPDAPGPFAFGRSERIRQILSDAGWRDIAIEPLDYPMLVGEGGDAIEDALSYFLRIGPAARTVAMLEGPEREVTLARLRGVVEDHDEAGRVALPAAAWIVTARAPA